MQSDDFVNVIDQEVGRAAIDGVMMQLESPAGRRPPETIVQLSQWYKSLDDAGRDMVRKLVTETASATLFGFYCALDGSRTIVSPSKDERLELIYRGKTGDRVIASTKGDAAESLHELRGSLA